MKYRENGKEHANYIMVEYSSFHSSGLQNAHRSCSRLPTSSARTGTLVWQSELPPGARSIISFWGSAREKAECRILRRRSSKVAYLCHCLIVVQKRSSCRQNTCGGHPKPSIPHRWYQCPECNHAIDLATAQPLLKQVHRIR